MEHEKNLLHCMDIITQFVLCCSCKQHENKSAERSLCKMPLNTVGETLTEKFIYFFVDLVLYMRMASEQVESPRQSSGCGVVALQITKIISYSSRIGLPEYHSNLFPRNARIVMKFPDLEFASNNFFRLKHIVTTKNSSCHKIILIRLRLETRDLNYHQLTDIQPRWST